jgi:HemY protein
MIRLVVYFALVAAAASGLAWVADRPGSLTVQWLGYDIRTSVFIAAIVLIIFVAAFLLAIWLGILTWTAPKRIARRMERRRTRIGQEALRRGIFAAGAGDKVAAMKAGAIAKKNVPDEPLALLLEAQSAQLNEDAIASRQAFERMLEKPEMAELGLRGLYMEAKKAGQLDAAKQFAERALTVNPALTWSSSALFEMQCREGDWRAALRTLGIAKQNRHLGKVEADKRRALLLTQLAIELEDTQQGKALAYALEAVGLTPTLTPAAAVAGRVLASQGNTSRATKLLSQAWRTTQHPEIALIYAHARTGESPRDRLARVKALVASGPSSLEGDIAVAVAAIEAKEWSAARLALEPHLANTPPARVCRLMARIEAGQNRDAGRAREWLAKAARGAPDPTWIAPDGTVSTEWQLLSPKSGALGVFEWKTPAMHVADGAEDLIAEMSALEVAAIEADGKSDVTPARESSAPGSSVMVAPNTKVHVIEHEDQGARLGGAVKMSGSEIEKQTAAPAVAAANQNAAQGQGASRGEDGGAREHGPLRDERRNAQSLAPEVQSVPKIGLPGKLKQESRKPTIFVPGPAPDDPGPRFPDGDDGSTPLSRFRGPS